ncbi:NmrA domain-containing protein [Mycena venus]|uniref:NmrA domain-containing protein n=1 Tax=Mycena venus TaxID=2733690 RepID=A0A8H6WT04_9AGAR|nr:NmrA domain-containing protein [Mycena venus]
MTITQDSSAPLVAVVGATGIQGGSVIDALAESTKPYRIRGFTRDATKACFPNNVKDVFKAFEGANMTFETAEGKMMVDAAKAAGVKRVVWSGLPAVSKHSGGKYTHVIHFDGKAVVTEYARQSGLPFVDVQAGYYASNLLIPSGKLGSALVKQTDGSFAMRLPVKPTTSLPVLDAGHDYGLYVRRALEAPTFPDGSEVRTGEYITLEDMALQLSQATGKKIVFEQITVEQFEKGFEEAGMPPHVVLDWSDGFQALNEFGYYGGKATSNVEGLPRTPLSLIEFAKAADWSKVLM